MFGVLGFIIFFSLANFYLIIVVGVIVWARKKNKKIPWRAIITLLVFQAVGSSFLLPRYYHQFQNYMLLRTVTASEISSIQIGSAIWTTPQDIETITKSLNQVVWHETNHDVGGPFVTMTVTLHSGRVWQAYIGRYYERDGTILEFFHPLNDEGAYQNDGTAYVPGLMIILENMGYSLPFE